jgi:hypothetical protein
MRWLWIGTMVVTLVATAAAQSSNKKLQPKPGVVTSSSQVAQPAAASQATQRTQAAQAAGITITTAKLVYVLQRP